MTPEERQLLAGLFDRVRDSAGTPRDRDAEAFIQDAVRAQPYAPYLLAQTVIVQEQALRAANDRIQQLEAEARQAQEQQQQQTGPAGSGSFLGGLGKSLFGGGAGSGAQQAPQNAPRGPWGQQQAPQGWGAPAGQPPAYGGQPGYSAPAPQQAGGGGSFLHGALGAAAGVAGGVLLADSIRGLFGGHNNALGIGSGFGGGTPAGAFGGGETVINNYYDTPAPDADPGLQTADYDDSSDSGFDSGDFGSDDSGTYDV